MLSTQQPQRPNLSCCSCLEAEGDPSSASQRYPACRSLSASQHALVSILTHCDSGCKVAMLKRSAAITRWGYSCFRSHSKDQHRVNEQDNWIPKKHQVLPCGQKHMFLSGSSMRHQEQREGGRQNELSKCHKNKGQNKSTNTHTRALKAVSCQRVHPSYQQLFTLLSVPYYVLIILVDGPSANTLLSE